MENQGKHATFTTIQGPTTIKNEYGNTFKVSLIHRTAGLAAKGSVIAPVGEVYMVRVERGDGTFSGQQYSVENKFEALMDYNRRVGNLVTVIV